MTEGSLEDTFFGVLRTTVLILLSSTPPRMAEVSQDTKLKEILERFVKGKKENEEMRKQVCLHICLRMLTEEGNFASEDSAHAAFSLHYHNILIEYFQKIIYPDETGPITRNQRGYLLRKIRKNIWATIWTIHTSPQV